MEKDYSTRINESIDKLFHVMEKRVSDEDITRIRSAYEFASEAHKEQRRKTGEPYIVHPIAVARIVAEELELGANPVRHFCMMWSKTLPVPWRIYAIFTAMMSPFWWVW